MVALRCELEYVRQIGLKCGDAVECKEFRFGTGSRLVITFHAERAQLSTVERNIEGTCRPFCRGSHPDFDSLGTVRRHLGESKTIRKDAVRTEVVAVEHAAPSAIPAISVLFVDSHCRNLLQDGRGFVETDFGEPLHA